jgi:hypothetical protein
VTSSRPDRPRGANQHQPRAGQKVFIVTCQHKNGWKAQDHVTSAIAPPKPLPGEQQRSKETKAEEAVAAERSPQAARSHIEPMNHPLSRPAATLSPPERGEGKGEGFVRSRFMGRTTAQTAPDQGRSSLSRAMYKGSTPGARGMHKLQAGEHPWSIRWAPLVHGLRAAMGRLAALGMGGPDAVTISACRHAGQRQSSATAPGLKAA